MILELLKEGSIRTKVLAATWEDAGRIAGRLLVDSGGVQPDYVDAMLDSVRKFGPYIVLMPGVALFHARPQDGVNKVCMSLITLAEGVSFNAGEKDPVKLVFAFGAVDQKAHIAALKELMSIFRDPEVMKAIEGSQDEFQIINIIKNKLGQ